MNEIEYKRNYVGLALRISFIMSTFWLSVRFRMYEWLFGPFVTLGVCVCVLSAWMSRLGHGGVSKCYAPITAFPAQSPDHIPTCYLTLYTDCLSLYVSSQQSYYLSMSLFLSFYLTAFFSQ